MGYRQKVNQSVTSQTKPYNTLPPGTAGYSVPDRIRSIRVDVSPTHGSNFWGPRERIYQILDMSKFHFYLENVFMVDARFELTTINSSPFDDAIC